MFRKFNFVKVPGIMHDTGAFRLGRKIYKPIVKLGDWIFAKEIGRSWQVKTYQYFFRLLQSKFKKNNT